jgi:hypothetical protein
MADSSFPLADGLSFETCLYVDSVEEEYEWLDLKYPGFELVEQSVQHYKERPFDVFEILLMDGSQLTVYFDISEFFGKESDFLDDF